MSGSTPANQAIQYIIIMGFLKRTVVSDVTHCPLVVFEDRCKEWCNITGAMNGTARGMNIRTVILIYLVVFVWLVIYHFVLGQDEITFHHGPQVLVGPAGQAYYQPMVANPTSGGSGQLVGVGVAVYLIYTLLKFLIPVALISVAGRSFSD